MYTNFIIKYKKTIDIESISCIMKLVKKGVAEMKLERSLRKLRLYEDMTLKEVGDQVNLPPDRVYKIENNQDVVAYGTVLAMFNAIGYDLELVRLEKKED